MNPSTPPMIDPRALREHYSHFLKPGRILLTGHSHQAWPDVARDGMLESFQDAAELVDDKWERAFAAADAVRNYVAQSISAAKSQIALAPNTHELVTRMLSACDWSTRRHLVTTTGEFHSINRQLRRAASFCDVTFVDAQPANTLSERLIAALTPRTAAVLVSTVLFETSERVPHLSELVSRARNNGTEVLLDAYHAFGVVPFSLDDLGARDAFVVAGGYKYAQWGEGNCFMVVPPRAFEPMLTGWFAGFGNLTHSSGRHDVRYGASGAEQFAGSTYDPTSHYRARSVIRFFQDHHLSIPNLREISLRQTQRLIDALGNFDLATPRDGVLRGGFVSVRMSRADEIARRLKSRGIFVDHRGDLLRLGPAPYIIDDELDEAAGLLRTELTSR